MTRVSDSHTDTFKWYTGAPGINNTLEGTIAGAGENVWFQVAGTFDGATKNLYVNGRLNASVAWGQAISYAATTSWFGSLAGSSSTQAYTGYMDHAAVWNRALTAGEVDELYRRPFAFLQTGPRAAFAQAAAGHLLPLLGVGA